MESRGFQKKKIIIPLLERKLMGAFSVDFLGYADVAVNREENCHLLPLSQNISHSNFLEESEHLKFGQIYIMKF
jgi:hypothetical protein